MRGVEEIAPDESRASVITSHAIGIPALASLLDAVPALADTHEYQAAVVDDNVLGLATDSGRKLRFKTLRRLYRLGSGSFVFRALRDLWSDEEEGRPLLATLCALTTDTVFRTSATVIVRSVPGDEITALRFAETIEEEYPGAYATSTLTKAAENAYASWQQSGHLGAPTGGRKLRQRATCRAADVAYALLLGHIQGCRGEALFETLWAQVLDQPRTHLYDLAFAASQRGMIEYRNSGGVVEVSFRELLRPMEGQLL